MRFLSTLLLPVLGATLAQCASVHDLDARMEKSPYDKLVTYPVPAGVPVATSYEVKIRVPGGKWQNITSYVPQHKEINITTGSSTTHSSSVAYFDFNGTVEVSATFKSRVQNAEISPLSFGIVPKVSGRTIRFQLSKPSNIVVKPNGQIFDALHLFANPLNTYTPSPEDKDVLYYGPGLHDISKTIEIPSGKTLYIAGGAVLSRATLQFNNATNAAIRGRGVLQNGVISLTGAKNIVVDGVIGLNTGIGLAESTYVEIRNWRSFTSGQWGDGIPIYSSKHVLIDSAFLRTSDDSISIYNHRGDAYGNTTNITVQNTALWADVAHPINLGTHGNTPNPETFDGITFRNLDILDHREKQILYQGAIALNAGDSNLIENVLIEDVRVENFRLGQLLNFRVMYNDKYNTSPGRGIRNVLIKNLKYDGTNALTSIFSGYDAERTISNVTFQNLTVNGLTIYDGMRKPTWYLFTDYIPMYANEHVKNLTFIA